MTVPVVQCVDAMKSFGSVRAVDNVTMALQPGEILSVLGPSGSGKTTLLRLIAGFERLDSGQISIQDRIVSRADRHVPPERRKVGMLFQEYALFPHLTVAQNVAFGLRNLTRDARRRRVADVMDLVRLPGLEDRYPHELSGGQQQRVALARTLAPQPVTMLLDEPLSNLDADMRSEMRREVESILRQNRISTVVVTHDRETAFAMADRIAVMQEGRIEQIDTPAAVYNSPATPFVARITGTCDFLSAEIRNGRAVTEIGSLPWSYGDVPLDEGAKVVLLIHVGDLNVEADPRSNSVVLSRDFRGDETILVVGLPSGASVRCRERSYATVGLETRVSLSPARPGPFVAFKRTDAET